MKAQLTIACKLANTCKTKSYRDVVFQAKDGKLTASCWTDSGFAHFTYDTPLPDFRHAVTAADLKKALSLSPTVKIDLPFSINGIRLTDTGHELEPAPERIYSNTLEITEDLLPFVKKASAYCGQDNGRPIFQNVYIDSKSIVGTNTHYLYLAKGAYFAEDAKYLIPANLVQFFSTNGTINIWKSEYCYRHSNIDIIWCDPGGMFPDFHRVIPEKKENAETVTFDKTFLATAKNLLKTAKVQTAAEGDELAWFNTAKLFQSAQIFNPDYMLTILETFKNRPVTFHSGKKFDLSPSKFECGDEIVVITPIRLTEELIKKIG